MVSAARLFVRSGCLALASLAGLAAADGPQRGPTLTDLVEAYYEALLRLNPVLATFNGDHRFDDRFTITIAPDHLQRARELEQRYLDAIDTIDPQTLAPRDRTTWEVFRQGRLQQLDLARHPSHLLPVNQFFSVPNVLPQLGAGTGFQPFETVADHDRWLRRAEGWGRWVDQAIANMREGIERSIVQPKVVMEKALDQLAAQITDDPEQSVFFEPVRRLPKSVPAEERRRLTTRYKKLVRDTIVPGYRKLHDFIKNEYLPQARRSAGLSSLPGGAEWYASEVRRYTTTDLTPREIHELGLAEVARISAEIEAASRRDEGGLFSRLFSSAGSGSRSFTSEADMLDSYRALRGRVEAELPKLFAESPRADFEIRPVEPFRQRTSAGAHYVAASPDGSRPGIFYVNTSGWRSRSSAGTEALFLHEAIPGHHFQISIQREAGDLPRFRRFGQFTAYTEGWALYVESLGRDLGLYRDRDQYLAALQSELFRAKRLVVDTGLHAMGWSRERAIDYLGSVREVERYIVLPGQALAYKIGQLKILELRRRAEARLGKAFDIRAFHTAVLSEGALPVSVLESLIDAWIATHLPHGDVSPR